MKLRKATTMIMPLLGMGCAWAATEQKPNVVVILADDLGYGDLGCYGARGVETPNVDRLAHQGIRFTHCHASAATSTPSRYGLLTGHYAWRRPDTDVAAGNAGMIIHPEQYTLADLFHDHGYATGAIGKWHLGLGEKTGQQDWNRPLTQHLRDIGFDYHYIMAATADRVPCVYIENGAVVNHDPAAPIEVSYRQNFPGEPTGAENPELLYNLKPSHGHDMSIVNGISRIGYMKGGGRALWKDENIADSITQHALQFIRDNRDNPFFLYFCTNDVHVPRFPHPRFRGKSTMGLRGDAIAQFDWSVGALMDELERLGLTDNTLVILTSDNGPVLDDGYLDLAEELLGEHRPTGPYRGNKYSSFEGGTAVPMIVRWPQKIQGNKESGAMFSLIDMMGSMSHLLGASLPQGQAIDTRNHLTALLGEDDKGCEYVLEQNNIHVLSLRSAQWKYIEPSNGAPMITWGPKIETGNLPRPQLYDMTSDEGEQHNVADQHPDVVKRFQEELKRLRAK